MLRKRRYTDQQLIDAVKNSFSYRQVFKKIGLAENSGYDSIKKKINSLKLDTSHFTGQAYLKGRTHNWTKKKPLKELMVRNSTYDRGNLKKRLLKENILENKCAICGLLPEWENKKLVMVLDHINGINNDHRLENLRLLCPNCNSQQDTFCGKNVKKKLEKKIYCIECGTEITKQSCSQLCVKCFAKNHRKVKNRPSKERLLKEVKEINYCAVGRKYGVTDNCIRKWLK